MRIFRGALCISPQIDWNHFLHRDKNPLPSPFHLIVLLIIGLSQIQRTGVIIILMHPVCVHVRVEECFGVCREKRFIGSCLLECEHREEHNVHL